MQDSLRGLRAHIEVLLSKRSSTIVDSGSSQVASHLPLNRFQSRLLADLVMSGVQRSTWWSQTQQVDGSWAMFGGDGEGSGPRVMWFISATSDNDYTP